MFGADLFPRSVHVRSLHVCPEACDLTRYHALHPLEKALVKTAIDRRKAEFGDARWCAHEALRAINAPADLPIGRGPRGEPLWPDGCVGSLTHTRGLRVAVAASTAMVRSLGVDVEPAASLPPGMLSSIARCNEFNQLDRLEQKGIPCADRVLFCAKEATYKAWFPLTGRYLDFDEADIDVRSDGTFISYLLARPTPVPFFMGRWLIRDGYIMTAITVSASIGSTAVPRTPSTASCRFL